MSESENRYEYRLCATEENSRFLGISEEREKDIILLLVSTDMRVGAVHLLLYKDLKKWVIDENGNYIYQVHVYSSSSKYKYYTFCTPECAKAIDSYLDLRKRYGEKLMKTETGWAPANTHLIIRAFNKKSSYHNSIPLTYRSTITRNILVPKLESLDLRTRHMHLDDPKKQTVRQHRNELHPCHSFRIYAITQMQRAKIDKTIREMLVGHSTGLDSVYYKASEEEIFEEYKKTLDYLSINNNFRGIHSQKEKQMKDNDILLLKEKYEQDINNLKDDMNNKFTQILSIIQQNPLLMNVKPEVLSNLNSLT
jgi:hypothetical protein